ncbi:Arylsulfotransferase (ASST) [Roseivivax halotolerans]|uniref:Arylsulfotransferase (ASST) n=1 Tax=Roseivivax halotolerans TaxID=93684 RepID=A0A1I6A4Q1_9RHOB|nr:arylsulfotransferase family protein [Roseivivax halotolerans]SFQ63689.1 Arylsulfotransferase (ASST) [Roseivivax halotolerans]
MSKPPLSDRLAPVVFAVSIGVLGIVYGTVASWWGWFPAPQLGLAHRTYVDIKENWRNDIGLEPTRHLVPPGGTDTPDPERDFTAHQPQKAQDGFTLVSGLNTDVGGTFHTVRLYDGEGEEVHRWPIPYAELDGEIRPQNTMLHGMEVFEDGSIAVTFDTGQVLTRLDSCGEPMWSNIDWYHHTLTRDGQGNMVTWRGETIVWVDEDTGEEVRSLDLRGTIARGNDRAQQGYLDLRTVTLDNTNGEIRYGHDPFHPNDAEPLTEDLADAFPMFEVGDVMISLREINLVAVVDPVTGRMKWWQHGPWLKQHDPDFQPDGSITVYDNNPGTKVSRIMRVDPQTRDVSIDFTGSEEVPFYSWRRGKHQVLANGNLLLTEAERGRLLEVDPAGQLVWERHMVWDADSNVIVTEARNIPRDFFADGVPSCVSEVAQPSAAASD